MNAMLGGVIAAMLAPPGYARKGAAWICATALLLSLGPSAQQYGFAAYSVSHNSSNLFGLLGCILMLAWLRKRGAVKLVLWGVIHVAAAISDPWLLPAYTLPSAAALLLFCLSELRARNRNWLTSASFFAVAVLVYWTYKHRLFGYLSFLPLPLSNRAPHAEWAGKLSTTFDNIVSIFGVGHWIGGYGAGIVFAVVALLIFVWIFRSKPPAPVILFATFAVLSTTALIAAAVVTTTPATIESERFMVALPYWWMAMAVGTATRYWSAIRAPGRGLCWIAAFSIASCNVHSLYRATHADGFQPRNPIAQSFVWFARENGLRYGYGPYWGSQANVVTLLGHDVPTLRPVTFNSKTGMIILDARAQAAASWFPQAGFPSDVRGNFVVVMPDPDGCASAALCLAGLSRQFGKPDRVLYFENWTIPVWDRGLMGAGG